MSLNKINKNLGITINQCLQGKVGLNNIFFFKKSNNKTAILLKVFWGCYSNRNKVKNLQILINNFDKLKKKFSEETLKTSPAH